MNKNLVKMMIIVCALSFFGYKLVQSATKDITVNISLAPGISFTNTQNKPITRTFAISLAILGQNFTTWQNGMSAKFTNLDPSKSYRVAVKDTTNTVANKCNALGMMVKNLSTPLKSSYSFNIKKAPNDVKNYILE